MSFGFRPVLAIGIAAALAVSASAAGWRWPLPAGVAPPPVPADNAMSAARVELGRRLFYDADLSVDGTMSCATCHEQRRGFADGNRSRPGVHGDPGRRNVPGLTNVAWLTPLTWADPAQTTLEKQVSVPVLGLTPVEMGMQGQEAEIARRLGRDACYRQMFAQAFPETDGTIDFDRASKAIAAFERTLISYRSSYDRKTLSVAATRGSALFAVRCSTCHAGPNFTDGAFHAIGTRSDPRDPGLAEKSGNPADANRFRTAPLRNVALAPPYLHDGSAPTLAAAIRRHDATPEASAAGLSEAQIANIAAFIEALTDRDFVTDKRLAFPDKACGRRL